MIAVAIAAFAGCILSVSLVGLAGVHLDASVDDVRTQEGDSTASDGGTLLPPEDGNSPPAPDAGERLLFDDEFDASALSSDWTVVAGNWAVSGGTAAQTDASAGLAFMFVPSLAPLDDYRVVTSMRQLGGSPGGAIEIDFRVQPTPPHAQYICNWEPNDREFLIMYTNPGADSLVLVDVAVPAPPGYDPNMAITMELVVHGDSIRCRLLEIPGAVGAISDSRLSGGSVGLKTYAMSATFDYFRVYEAK